MLAGFCFGDGFYFDCFDGFYFGVGSGGSMVASVGLVVDLWFSGGWCFSGGSGWFHGDSVGEVKQKKFFG